MKDVISSVADRSAAEQFAERYARVFLAMSMEQAKTTLGFKPFYTPTPEEIQKAYRALVIANHPDRGGNPEKMVEINVAKDILEGKARPSSGGGAGGRPPPGAWRPEPTPERKRPEPPKVVDVIKGKPFDAPSILTTAEIKFISKTAYGSARPDKEATGSYSYDMWAIYARNESTKKHIFIGLRNRRESSYFDHAKGGLVQVEESWEFIEETYPLSKDLTKIASTAIKKVMTGWEDGLKPMRQLKYIEWPGGKLTEAAMKKVKSAGHSGGAPLKDILIGQGLVDGEAAEGRKANVEIYFKANKEKRLKFNERMKGLSPGQRLSNWLAYDWFVRLNGTEYLLKDKTVENLIKKHFLSMINANGMGEGVPKNLSKMKGSPWSRFTPKAHEAIDVLVDCLSGEPTGLVLGLMKAIEDWEEHFESKKTKKAALRALVACTDIHEAAHLAGLEPHEILRAWE